MLFKKLVLGICITLATGACCRTNKAPVHIPQASDSLYTARAALKIYGTQPERALVIVDSALIVGNVSSFRADFLRAMIYANSVERPQPNKALALCEGLLKHDSTLVVDKRTFDNRNNVLGVIMDVCRKKGDDERWLQYAIERAELSRNHGMETEALRMEAEIGAAMTRLGRQEEGLIKLEQVIRVLDQGEPSIDRMDAGIIARKRRINVYELAGRAQDMISDARAIINILEDYKSRPSAYADDSFRLSKESNMGRYCDFYTAQAWANMARAYSLMSPPNLPEVRKYTKMLEESAYGHTFSGRTMIAPAWKCLGQWDKLMAIDAESEKRLGTDTLNLSYATILKDRADEARAKGLYNQAISFMERYASLIDKLSEKRHESEAHEYAARYHALEQEQKIREAQAMSARKDAIILAIVLVLLIITAFAIHSVRQRHAIAQKNKVLAKMINEMSNAPAPSQEETTKPDKELFDMIDGAIRREKLYTNVRLQRQDIIDRFDISRHNLNDLLSAYANGQSFTAYINGIRMQDAIHMMQKEQDSPVSAIAEAVGFTPANFREQFKHQFGLTPTEYRNNL